MADSQAKPPKETEKKISNTTYIVTSHFREHGGTAIDKVKRLIDLNTKEEHLRHNT